MSELLKNYEISIWEDELVTLENGESYYQEKKLAVIGGNNLSAPNKVFDPVLKESVNETATLTFSLQHYYYDEEVDDYVINPIYPLLINERKIKLFYNDKWYDFILKEREEKSEDHTFSYTAIDIFVNELSKQGYNVELNQELNNNLGTVTELGAEVVKNTEWTIDEGDSDLLQQTVKETVVGRLVEKEDGITVRNLDTQEIVTIPKGEELLVFYSYISSGDWTNIQFLRNSENQTWELDDDEVIVATNYRYEGILDKDALVDDSVVSKYLGYQAYRLVYQPRALYDPRMEQYVELYRAEYDDGTTQDIYKATSSEYNTSNVVVSFVTNGSRLNFDEGKTIVGWENTVKSNIEDGSNYKLLSLNGATYPPLLSDHPLANLETLRQVSSYLDVNFIKSATTAPYTNFIFNNGIMKNGAIINNISKDEEYAFRIRGGIVDSTNPEAPAPYDFSNSESTLKVIVAKYTTENQMVDGMSTAVKTFDTKNIIFDFPIDKFVESPNVVTGGEFKDITNPTVYYIDNVPQTPDLSYYYEVTNEQGATVRYIWDPIANKYTTDTTKFLKTYITTAKAKMTVNNAELTDPKERIGIFIGSTADNKRLYLSDIELFRCIRDTDGNITLPGNLPKTVATDRTLFYLKPTNTDTSSSINTYASLESIAGALNVPTDKIKQVYNENCEKILTIEESRSNCFNILQTLCETFECWLKLTVEHEENGAIKLDENHKPIKKIAFKEFIGDPNFAGFKYGINLNSINRTVDSNEIVTKLIVADQANEYADNGILSISVAAANPLKEGYIYSLDYYVQNGLIQDRDQYIKDITELRDKISPFNQKIQELNTLLAKANAALLNVESQANVYTETTEETNETLNDALEKFKEQSGLSYTEYLEKNPDSIAETLLPVVGEIYQAQALLNNIGGANSAANEEFSRLHREVEGAPDYGVTISVSAGHQADPEVEGDVEIDSTVKVLVDDYILGFNFTLKNEDGLQRDFSSSLNQKEFTDNTPWNRPYTIIEITGVPQNYMLQYVDMTTGETRIIPDGKGTFDIFDATEGSMSRTFTLIPTKEYKEANQGYQDKINQLIEEKQQYINDFERKYRQYIQEGTWESDNYIDSNLYYFDALQVSQTSAKPQVSYNISVTEVSTIEGLENYSFKIGDKTYVEDPEFFGWYYSTENFPDDKNDENDIIIKTPIREEVILSEIEWHLDDPSSNSITVQNYKTRFDDLFQRISAAVQQAEYNSASLNRLSGILGPNGELSPALLTKSMSGIMGETYPISSYVKVDDSGIIAQDSITPGNMMKLAGNGVFTSQDSGKTWTNIISADGITTDALTAGTINTQQVSIMDGDNTSFRWDQTGLNAYGGDGTEGYDLTSFVRMDRFGIYGVKHGEDENGNPIYTYDNLDDVIDVAHFSLTWDGFRIKSNHGNGYVSITSDNDFEVVQTFENSAGEDEDITKIKIGALEFDNEGVPNKYGINIYNDSGEPVFTTNDDGNITITGRLNATEGDFSGQVRVGEGDKFIIIDGAGEEPYIASSDYLDNPQMGWVINGLGDATFNNVSVRGAIKTAVFEYSEIEAVGGAFLFRPSTSIKDAMIKDNDLALKVENATFFNEGEWIKLSNCNDEKEAGGLSHIYKVKSVDLSRKVIVLEGAAASFTQNALHGQAYAVYDSTDSSLTFFRDFVESYWQGQIEGTKTYYTDFETIERTSGSQDGIIEPVEMEVPWIGDSITTVIFEDLIAPTYTTYWFKDQSDLTTITNSDRLDFSNLVDMSYMFDGCSSLNGVEFTLNNIPDTYSNVFNNAGSVAGSIKLYYVTPITSENIDELIENSGATEGYVINGGSKDFEPSSDPTEDETDGIVFERNEQVDPLTYWYNGVLTDQELIEGNTYNFEIGGTSYTGKVVNNGSFVGIWEDDYELFNGASIILEEELTGIVIRLKMSFESTGEIPQTLSSTVFLEDTTILDANVEDLIGGALISFGYAENTYIPYNIQKFSNPKALGLYEQIDVLGTVTYQLTSDEAPIDGKTYYKECYEEGRHNYGIGINSSDNYINLPERAISLFETKVHPNESIKVTYDFKGILGTLPPESSLTYGGQSAVNSAIYKNMEDTQGIYTDNMYIGDKSQYVAFYTDKTDGKKHLKISAKELIFEDDGDDVITWQDIIDEGGVQIVLETTFNANLTHEKTNGLVYPRVLKGGVLLDIIPENLVWGEDLPTTELTEGDYYVHLENREEGDKNRLRPVLKQYTNGEWIEVPINCKYSWRLIGDTSTSSRVSLEGQFLYLTTYNVNETINVEVAVEIKE